MEQFSMEFAADFSAAETALYNEFAGKDIVIWEEGTKFINLKIDHFYQLQSVNIILMKASLESRAYQNYSMFQIVFTLFDNNGDFKEVGFVKDYSGDSDKYKNRFSEDMIDFAKKYFRRVNELNVDIIDGPSRTYFLLYNEELKKVYDSKVLAYQNALKQQELWKKLLKDYEASNYIYFSDLIDDKDYEPVHIRKEWEERDSVRHGTLMFLQPGETDIFGTKPNTYICETSYFLLRYNGINAVAQFVVIDNIGVIKTKEKSIIKNANGPDTEITRCFLSKPILLKCIGQTNITLNTGRVVPRLLFQTIKFRNDDPNKPK
jgi:hypothetical protein